MSKRIDRRQVLKAATLGYAATFIPRSAWGANERINIAGIGVGGKGAGEVSDLTAAGAKFVALCDVDTSRAAKTYKNHPDAKVYTDFRVMLDKEKGIDAVTVSTPDHTHAIASLAAMALGKHVYCQKPLTQTIHEARLMTLAARHFKVKTQMGNQAHAGEPIRRAVELVRAGLIGPVREVHCWTNRPIWPQGAAALAERTKFASQSKPADLDWDLWLGPAKQRDYNACYVPFKWRGWWDFGTGALGDMACHIMDMPYWALDLGSPESVEAESGGMTAETGAEWSTIVYQFPARKSVGGATSGAGVGPVSKVAQPPVKFVWYDGVRNQKPNAPYELLARATKEAAAAEAADTSAKDTPANGRRPRNQGTIDSPARWDLILVGDDGLMLFNRGSEQWIVTPGSRAEMAASVPKTLPRVENEDAEWLSAIRGESSALSNFDYAGPFTEVVLLGNLAVRLGKKINWDSTAMKAVGVPEADALIRSEYRKGWALPYTG
ncbi:MAG: Gfo/Idh/MocA family oxidoreductase [Pirellulaceae bacterium]|nr:Gfo/Idh/MocA family oxidoreductase [Pirellulaceae bacterium]